MKINFQELFPKLEEELTPKGVGEIKEISILIEKMTEHLSANEIARFLSITDGGNYRYTYDIFHEIQKQKSM